MGLALPGAKMHAPNEWIPASQLEPTTLLAASLLPTVARGPAVR